mmetsp:Transcript_14440/g.36467  ORF Transcript_14440/g.36467 Transcript_14440/m.36467 type:complete len:173 (-) Transcript_14440:904-1422(-)
MAASSASSEAASAAAAQAGAEAAPEVVGASDAMGPAAARCARTSCPSPRDWSAESAWHSASASAVAAAGGVEVAAPMGTHAWCHGPVGHCMASHKRMCLEWHRSGWPIGFGWCCVHGRLIHPAAEWNILAACHDVRFEPHRGDHRCTCEEQRRPDLVHDELMGHHAGWFLEA